jgi:hypothetical protein
MSGKNNKNLASQALLEMDAITSAIKEESKNTLNTLLAEAVRNALRECCEEEEDKEYDIIDDENDAEDKEDSTKEAKSDMDEEGEDDMIEPSAPNQNEPAQQAPMTNQEMPQEAPESGENGEWDEFSQYQTGDNTYDLTGENDYEKIVKVYKLLKDDDQVVVTKDANTIHLSDNESGTEYVIDLGDEGDEPKASSNNGEEIPGEEMSINESEIAGFDDSYEFDDDSVESEDEFAVDNDFDNNYDEEEIKELERAIESLQQRISEMEMESKPEENNIYENRKTRKPMKENKEVLFEVDLGYTDNYQDKDPIAGLSNNEPSKNGKSWHKGVPSGTSKPWAGKTKSKGEPFGNIVNEEDDIEDLGGDVPMEEGAMSVSSQSVAKKTKTRTSSPRRENMRQVGKSVSTANKGYEDVVNENKKLKKDIKVLKEAIMAFRKDLNEAYVTNANLGKITKLFLENTTSQSEKVDIVNRFSNEAKTIEQSKALYESIKRELNKTNPTFNINESVSVKSSKLINEDKVYKSADLIKTIDFMNRVMNY